MSRRNLMIAIVTLVVLGLIFWGVTPVRKGSSQPLTVSGFALPEMPEGGSAAMTCSATASGGITSVDIRLVNGTGLLEGDTDPAPDNARQVYNPRSLGKSRDATFNCVGVANNGDTNSVPLTTIVRDARNPEWDGAAPVVPALGGRWRGGR